MEEFYKEKLRANLGKRNHRARINNQQLLMILGLALVFLILPLSLILSKRVADLRTRAGSTGKDVSLLLFPSEIPASSNPAFTLAPKLSGPEGKKVSAVSISIRFDPKTVHLKSLQSISPVQLALLKSTPIDEANTSGIIKLFLGAESSALAPSGVVNLPFLNFELIGQKESTVRIDKANTQVLFTSQEYGNITEFGETKIQEK